MASPKLSTDWFSGHSGLSVAAHLQQLGVTSLIIDKNARVGDNWRNRYKVRYI